MDFSITRIDTFSLSFSQSLVSFHSFALVISSFSRFFFFSLPKFFFTRFPFLHFLDFHSRFVFRYFPKTPWYSSPLNQITLIIYLSLYTTFFGFPFDACAVSPSSPPSFFFLFSLTQFFFFFPLFTWLASLRFYYYLDNVLETIGKFYTRLNA